MQRVPSKTTNVLFCYKPLWCNISFHTIAVSFNPYEERINQVHTAISEVITEVLQTFQLLWVVAVLLVVKFMMFQRIMVPSSLGSRVFLDCLTMHYKGTMTLLACWGLDTH